jgi:V/A-type H+/Na+-transporting ATPase subunit D
VNAGDLARTPADRLRLIHRLELTRHASGLLHSKEEALERERARLEGHASRSLDDWAACCDEASQRLARARMLGASDELARLVAVGAPPASVEPDWQTSMGITYPGGVECTPGEPPPVTSTAALRPTIDAFGDALQAGARHAAATMALRRLDHELADTRRRRRAIEDHLEPSLERLVHELDLRLDEVDRDEALRVRLATRNQKGARS